MITSTEQVCLLISNVHIQYHDNITDTTLCWRMVSSTAHDAIKFKLTFEWPSEFTENRRQISVEAYFVGGRRTNDDSKMRDDRLATTPSSRALPPRPEIDFVIPADRSAAPDAKSASSAVPSIRRRNRHLRRHYVEHQLRMDLSLALCLPDRDRHGPTAVLEST